MLGECNVNMLKVVEKANIYRPRKAVKITYLATSGLDKGCLWLR